MAPPNQEKHQHRQCDADHSKVILNAAVLEPRHQLAADSHATATLVEAQINYKIVDRSVYCG
jgi:hypothetical protein